MSDREMRNLLQQVMADIEASRGTGPRLPRRLKRGLGPWLAPPLLAASLGLAACGNTAVGTDRDATVTTDAVMDASPPVDAAYMAPFDAEADIGVMPPYMAPPFDAGPEPDYASPFDAAVEDGGSIPVYMGPPPQDD